MAKSATATSESTGADLTALAGEVSAALRHVEAGALARAAALTAAPSDAAALVGSLAATGSGLWRILAIAGLAAILVVALRRGFQSWLDGRLSPRWRDLAADALALLVAIPAVAIARFALGPAIEAETARLWAFGTAVTFLAADLVRACVLTPHAAREEGDPDPSPFVRLLTAGVSVAIASVVVDATLKAAAAGPGLRDATTLLGGIGAVVVLCWAYGRERDAVRALIRPRSESSGRRGFARAWPYLAIALVLVTFAMAQVARAAGASLPSLPVILTVVFALLTPHLDRALARWEAAAAARHASVGRVALRATTRLALLIAVVCAVGGLWIAPVSAALGLEMAIVPVRTLEIALVALCAAYLWNLVGASAERLAAAGPEAPSEEAEGVAATPASRLSTLAPILAGTAKAMIGALTALTILVALGINAWPLVTGLSVFGLAIGFGSQSLVKDIVSGAFYLFDDAFRMGEYIETSGAKGTVERISIRSLSLRHPRGQLATVPYGQIGKVVNFSRDWVIEKLVFRVAFDTDVELVRKLFKSVGQEIAADPVLSRDLLQPFKSQGIATIEDGTLVIRGKFMARAGQQFGIRKAVYSAVQRRFRENGIVAVPRLLLPAPVSGS